MTPTGISQKGAGKVAENIVSGKLLPSTCVCRTEVVYLTSEQGTRGIMTLQGLHGRDYKAIT